MLMVLFASLAQAQLTTVFQENFDGTVQMTSAGTPGWTVDPALQVTPSNSMNGKYGTSNSSTLTTPAMNFTGNPFVFLDFDQIGKISFFDEGAIEVSTNGGTTWTEVTNFNATYVGGSNNWTANNNFTAQSYSSTWLPGNDAAVPTNGWWKHERFDLGGLLGNQPNCLLRFKVGDQDGNGMNGANGWNLDNISIVMSNCEQVPPAINVHPTSYLFWSTFFSGQIYNNTGPFDIEVSITDISTVLQAELHYTINGVVQPFINMVNPQDSSWVTLGSPPDQIPAGNVGDTICWYIVATDASACFNIGTSVTTCFVIVGAVCFPYCDNFESGNPAWTPTQTGTSAWQVGTPGFGLTNSAHSFPNAWDIDRATGYANNATCNLTSTSFDFTCNGGVYNAFLDFWLNYNTDFNDGASIQYSNDNGTTWITLPTNASATNWYDGQNQEGDAWSGVSNGWKNSTYQLATLGAGVGGQPSVLFRFRFRSDASSTFDGLSMDDFCVKIPPPNDVGADSILKPIGAQPSNTIVPIVVQVCNYGSLPQTSFPVTYLVSPSGQTGTFTWTGNLLGGQCASFQLPDSVPINNGVQSICAWATLPDPFPENDTTCSSFFGVATVDAQTYCDDFEGSILWNNELQPSGDPGTIWEKGTPAFGQTNSANSGTNAWDINLTTGYTANAFTYLVSPFFDFSTTAGATLSFWQNRNTLTFSDDGAWLEYSANGGGTWDTLGTVGDANATNWYTSTWFSNREAWDGSSFGWINSTYLLTGAPGINFNQNLVQFRFGFTSSGFGLSDGISIDDFCILLPPPDDIGISAIVTPGLVGVENDTLPITVALENFGSNTQTSVQIWLTGGNIYPANNSPYTWTGSIVTGQTINFTLPDSIIIAGGLGLNNICAYTAFPGDTVPSNDTSCVNVFGVATVNLSYCDNFDSGVILWSNLLDATGDPGTNWELGTPGFGQTNTPFSPPTAWDINLNNTYTNNAFSYMNSPFFDFSSVDSVRLSFMQNWNTETNWDGTRLEYSIDGGTSWTKLGTVGSPGSVNWYTNVINSSNDDAWAGSSANITGNANGWVKCQYELINEPNLNNQASLVQFRFVFTSDASVLVDGVSIDNFSLKIPCPVDAAIAAIVQPNTNLPAGSVSPFQVSLLNEGTTPLDSALITYILTPPGTPTVFQWSGPALAPGASTTVTLPGFTVPSGAYCISTFVNANNDCAACNDSAFGCFVGIPTLPITYCDDFESGNVGWSTGFIANANQGTVWQFGTPAFGVTTGAHSGTTAWDVNLNSTYGNQAGTYLYSPFFDMDSAVNCLLSFWQNYKTDNGADGVSLEYSSNNGVSWGLLGTFNDPFSINWYNTAGIGPNFLAGWTGNSNGWKKSTYYLNNVIDLNNVPDKVQFRFLFTSDFFGNNDGYSIDDFCLIQPPPDDLGISVIQSPGGSAPAGVSVSPIVTLQNYGTNAQVSATITYSVNGVVQTPSFNWTGLITPGQNVPGITLAPFIIPSGNCTLCVYTQWNGDQNHANDTTCIIVVGVPTITVNYLTPYLDNFDSTSTVWTATLDPNGDPGSIWEWGAPNFGSTNSAHSSPNAWDINLNSAYTNNAFAYLYSPFFDFSNADDAIVRFWHNYNTETGWDGTRLEYSFDDITWNILGTGSDIAPDICGVNWYTDDQLNSSLVNAWEGNTFTWVQSEYDIACSVPNINSQLLVRFRFVFTSDAAVIVDGYSIDDFEIEVPIPVDITPVNANVAQNLINTLIFSGQTVNFGGFIKNKGTTLVTQATASLYEGGTNLISTDIFTFTAPGIAKKDSVYKNFSGTWVATPGVHEFCVVTSLPNGVQDLNIANDTTCFTIVVFDSVATYPYCNNFESGPQWVALNSENYAYDPQSWQLGLPAQTSLNGTHSGNNAWTLKLDANYINGDESSLFSPRFTISANKCYKLTFFHQFIMERFSDGGAVEMSTDNGATWSTIDFNLTPNASLFNYAYTSALSNTTLTKGWTGSSFATNPGWLYSEKILRPNINGTMIIRWKFAADLDSTQEGWSIDDVCLADLGFCSPIGIDELANASFQLAQNRPNPFGRTTTFDFTLPQNGFAKLFITDITGQIVAIPVQDQMQSGVYSINFDASTLAAGIYYYTLEYNDQRITRKMVITK